MNEDTVVNSHQRVSKRANREGHQVDAMNKIEYISFEDGDAKIQQDMLVVSVPFC